MKKFVGEAYDLWKYYDTHDEVLTRIVLVRYHDSWWVALMYGDDLEMEWIYGFELSKFGTLDNAVESMLDSQPYPEDKTPYYTDDYFKLKAKM